jgi:Flp pilus assembly pilin Flp
MLGHIPPEKIGTGLKQRGRVAPHHTTSQLKGASMQNLIHVLQQFHGSESGQDIMEYAIIVAFAVTVIAVLALLYNTIKDVLRNANSQLQGIR